MTENCLETLISFEIIHFFSGGWRSKIGTGRLGIKRPTRRPIRRPTRRQLNCNYNRYEGYYLPNRYPKSTGRRRYT